MALNLADLFEHAADTFPDRIAVACGDQTVTYQQFDERSNKLAHHLAGLGVGLGDHVGLYARNSIEALEMIVACYKLRAMMININYRYLENELRYLLSEAELKAAVVDRQFAPRLASLLPDLPGIAGTVVIEDGSGADSGQGVRYEQVLAGHSGARDFGPRRSDDHYMLYTGGTTGQPKGVIWRHEDVWRTLGGGIDFVTGEPLADEWEQSRRGAAAPAGMVRLCTAPLIHGSTQWGALPALFGGDTVVFVPQFDPHEVWRRVQQYKVNVLLITGDAMGRPLIEALKQHDYDVSSLVSISSNAALFSPVVKEEYLAAIPGAVITDAIGTSETGFTGLSFVSAGSARKEGPRVTPGPSTIVIDDDNRPVKPGQVGRLARGGYIPLGYYKDPVKTATLFAEVDGARYSVPGDLARLEEDGTITLLGRGNTCVNTGGEKVFPEEVEGALKRHPDIYDALVIGVPDERMGQRVAAVLQPRADRDLDLADLDRHMRAELSGYKVPRSYWLAEQIGRSPSGKPDYGWARRYADEHLAQGQPA